MARYIIETKQYSGEWIDSGSDSHKASSRAQAVDRARTQHSINQAPKRAVDTKTGEVLATFGETPEHEAWAARMRSVAAAEDARQPTSAEALGDAVSSWGTTEDGDTEADSKLLAVMVEQGVMTKEEAAVAVVTCKGDFRAAVTLPDTTRLTVSEKGYVHYNTLA